MTVGQLVLIVIGIGWVVYTYYTVQALRDTRGKYDMDDDFVGLNLIANVVLLIGCVVYLFLNYWDLVIF